MRRHDHEGEADKIVAFLKAATGIQPKVDYPILPARPIKRRSRNRISMPEGVQVVKTCTLLYKGKI